ncbi:MAG: hypothetical protein ACFFCS_25080 [Candidatus Hodarchaeota archaeon]
MIPGHKYSELEILKDDGKELKILIKGRRTMLSNVGCLLGCFSIPFIFSLIAITSSIPFFLGSEWVVFLMSVLVIGCSLLCYFFDMSRDFILRTIHKENALMLETLDKRGEIIHERRIEFGDIKNLYIEKHHHKLVEYYELILRLNPRDNIVLFTHPNIDIIGKFQKIIRERINF